MFLPDIFHTGNLQYSEILEANRKIRDQGLYLTPADAGEILKERERLLGDLGRIELDMKVIKLMIQHLSFSPFISTENYLSTIIDMQEVFYYLKNETGEQITDDEAVDIIIDLFNNSCAGSMELLRGKGLDQYLSTFREDSRNNDIYYSQGVFTDEF